MRDLESLSACESINKTADVVLQTRRHVNRIKKTLAGVERSILDLPWDADTVGVDYGLSCDEVKALRRDFKAMRAPLVAQRQQLRQELTAALKHEVIAEAILISTVSSALTSPLDPLPLDPEMLSSGAANAGGEEP